MTTDKRPRGAPKKDNPASKSLPIRLTPEQHSRWSAAADAAGLPLSTWLKKLADEAAGK